MVNQNQKFIPHTRGGELADIQPHNLAPYEEPYDDKDVGGLDFSIVDIANVLWERRWWVLLAALAGFIAALSYSLLQSPLYRATAVIELNPPTVPVLSGGDGSSEEMVVPTTDRQFQETQIGIMRSRALAERVVQDLNLVAGKQHDSRTGSAEGAVPNLAASLAQDLTVKPSVESRLVELSFVSDDPQEAAKLANGFATSFIDLTLDRKYEATTSARKFLENRIKTVREDINEAERKLVSYAKANGIVMIPGGREEQNSSPSTLTGESLGTLNAALAAAQQKRIAAEGRFRQAGSLTEGAGNSAALRQEKAKLEAEYREKSTYLQDSFPDMTRLKSRIDELDRQIRTENSRAVGTIGAEYRAALAEEQALQSKVSQLSGTALTEREDAIQYNILQRELDTSRSLYDALLERYNEVGVVEGIGTAQAALVDRAQVPTVPFAPSTMRNTAIGALLGLLLGGALAILYDRLTNTIKTKDDLRDKLGLAPVGAIPLAEKNSIFLDDVRMRHTVIYDAYASLRTGLQLATQGGFPRTLVVTSTRPEEGKSSTSYSLGVQLSDVGKRVLLIDGDMRKPSFLVGSSDKRGLSSLLTSETLLSEHVLKTTSENLFLLPSGPVPPNPTNIIQQARMDAILEQAMVLFDHVIIDAPPVAGFADSILLSACGDGVLFTVEANKTRTAMAKAALNRLRMAGAPLVGGALTKVSAKSLDYGYGYGYYYGAEQRSAETSIVIAEYSEEAGQRIET